jgi:hypothetical protein
VTYSSARDYLARLALMDTAGRMVREIQAPFESGCRAKIELRPIQRELAGRRRLVAGNLNLNGKVTGAALPLIVRTPSANSRFLLSNGCSRTWHGLFRTIEPLRRSERRLLGLVSGVRFAVWIVTLMRQWARSFGSNSTTAAQLLALPLNGAPEFVPEKAMRLATWSTCSELARPPSAWTA